MVGDEVVPAPKDGEPQLVERMIEIYERHSASVVAVQEVPKEDISSYGAIVPEFIEDEVARVRGMVEKPAVEDAPSNLASRGRYVLSPKIFGALERLTEQSHSGEIELTDAIRMLAEEEDEGVYAYVHSGPMFDVGKKLDYLKTTVELALRRDDLAEPFREYLVERLGS
jgi:UTP--glucose-1-phosphate uridylyltransferase